MRVSMAPLLDVLSLLSLSELMFGEGTLLFVRISLPLLLPLLLLLLLLVCIPTRLGAAFLLLGEILFLLQPASDQFMQLHSGPNRRKCPVTCS